MTNTTPDRKKSQPAKEPDASSRADRLEHDIESIRADLRNLVRELDARRRAAFSIRQLRRHPGRVVMVALALTAVVAGGVAFRRARVVQRRPRGLGRLKAFPRALWNADNPSRRGHDQVRNRDGKQKSSLALRLLAAAATGAASVLGKRVAQHYLQRRPQTGRQE